MEKVIFMELKQIYEYLIHFYPRIEPHHNTWMLWLKKKSQMEIFEVAIGTILVQNTSWKNVEIAIKNLFDESIESFSKLQLVDTESLENLIRPAGFYKQKARYLLSLADLFNKLNVSNRQYPTRNELLEVKGIGRETADSILVYCFYQPFPIIGTYTRRFLTRIYADLAFLNLKYELLQDRIKNEFKDDYFALGNFHAHLVAHCQKFCHKNQPLCEECFLCNNCKYGRKYKTNVSIASIQSKISKPRTKKQN
jgi:endonuclease-3 related protein